MYNFSVLIISFPHFKISTKYKFQNIFQPMVAMERTLIILKPESFKRRLIGKIIQRFEDKGLYLAASKVMKADVSLLDKHYKEHINKPFYKVFVKHMTSGEVMPMIFEGKNAVSISRKLIGLTDPLEAPMGSIRGDFGTEKGRNLIHGSDSVESAVKEIDLWFGKDIPEISHFDEEVLYE